MAAGLDLFSRFVVSWALSAVNDRRLTLKALAMAVARRCPDPGLLHHSDRGCTYTCDDYQNVSRRPGHHLQHESPRRLLRQCGDGEFLCDREEGGGRPVSQLQ